MRTVSASFGNVPLNDGPRLQFLRSRRWLSKAGLIRYWSSSFGKFDVVPGVLAAPCGVAGAAGEPACTAVEYGLPVGIDEVVDNVEEWILEAGRRQSRGSYGQLSEIVVVKGMKKVSNEVKGWIAMSRSLRRGLQ
jgi:hypothetical protein